VIRLPVNHEANQTCRTATQPGITTSSLGLSILRLTWTAIVLLTPVAVAACGNTVKPFQLRRTPLVEADVTPTPASSEVFVTVVKTSTPKATQPMPTPTAALPRSATPSRTPSPAPSLTSKTAVQPTQGPLSVEELLQRREDLIGKEILVQGKVLFDVICPPVTPQPYPKNAPCVATGYLVDRHTSAILPYQQNVAILLYEDGFRVGCTAPIGTPPSCNDWKHEQEYVIRGVMGYEILGGRLSNIPILEVLSKTPL
jgi:hypothetical protein